MVTPFLVSIILRARNPVLAQKRIEHFANAIVETVEAEGNKTDADDLDDLAALIVIGERESNWRYDVETCRVIGLEGFGTYGVGSLWESQFPGGTCGAPVQQAKAALHILHLGEGRSWRTTFGHYIGAKLVGHHPEAIRRARIFWQVRSMLACACSELV